MDMAQKLYYTLASAAEMYTKGEAAGRRDGARRYGKQDTRWMCEDEAMGYRDGYASTFHL